MTNVELIAKLQSIFRETFEDESVVLRNDLTADDLEAWDSLAHVRLMIAVEGGFGIDFTVAEIESLDNVGRLINLIEVKMAIIN